MKHLLYLLFIISSSNLGIAQIIYVDSSATTGANTGTQWEDAFTDLQDALAVAQDTHQIWVAKGTYFPTNQSDRNIYFQLNRGVELIGGFTGTETSLAERDWKNNPTILNADIGTKADSTDNSYTLIFAESTDSTTLIDGFTLANAAATNDTAIISFRSHKKNGGGIYLNSQTTYAALTIVNCSFRNNHSILNGGAIYLSGRVAASIRNCTFEKNSAASGGAIYQTGELIDGFGNEIINSTFNNNEGNFLHGGAISFEFLSGAIFFKIKDCGFNNNIVTNNGSMGGAISYFSTSNIESHNLDIESCYFNGNRSYASGDALSFISPFMGNEILIIDKCSFVNHLRHSIYIPYSFSSMNNYMRTTVKNSYFDNNNTGISGLIHELNNCIFKNNRTAISAVNIGSDLALTTVNNCTFFSSQTTAFRWIGATHDLIINNSIFQTDTAQAVPMIRGNESVTLNNCLFNLPDCAEAVSVNHDSLLVCNNVIVDVDPLFRDTATGDFGLRACSPAINAGDNELYDLLNDPNDFLGRNRIVDSIIDLGAIETLPNITVAEISPVDCNGVDNGSIDLSFNGPSPLTVYWTTDEANGNQLESLAAGLYNVIVSDSTGCSDSISIEIQEPDVLTTDYLINPTSCYSFMDGYANAMVAGGTAPYSFEWENGTTASEVFNLEQGYHTLTVTDSLGCTFADSILINEPADLSIIHEIQNASSASIADGNISISEVNGGTPPYNYDWADSSDGSLTRDSLMVGEYELVVTDANKCQYRFEFIIDFPERNQNLDYESIKIFPNPLTIGSPLTVLLPEHWNTANLSIFNTLGILIQTYKLDTTLNSIEINPQLTAGAYYFRINYHNQVLIQKLIIQE